MGTLVFQATAGGSFNFVGPNIAGTVSLTLPSADGTSGQFLKTDGAGTLSFAAASTAPGGSTTQVQYNNAGAFGGISGVTTDGTRLTASTTIAVGGATPSTSGAGVSFPATQSASTNANTLDDYEEGTWTPVLSDGTNNATMNGATEGFYTKIGNVVTLVSYTATTSLGSVSGVIRITGVPFAHVGSTSAGSVGYAANLNITANQACTVQINATTFILVNIWSAADGTAQMTGTQWSSDGAMAFQLTLRTA